jgi:hypothetical protein
MREPVLLLEKEKAERLQKNSTIIYSLFNDGAAHYQPG